MLVFSFRPLCKSEIFCNIIIFASKRHYNVDKVPFKNKKRLDLVTLVNKVQNGKNSYIFAQPFRPVFKLKIDNVALCLFRSLQYIGILRTRDNPTNTVSKFEGLTLEMAINTTCVIWIT